MAEPTTTGGISLTVIFVALLGPLAGPYALIAFAALAGALWPLSAQTTATRTEGAWLLLRCTLTAIVMTGVAASILERQWQIPVNEALAPVALLIGALGNGWRPVFSGLSAGLSALAGKVGGQSNG
ncbi:MAG: hypothetical protein PHD19_09340 [Dechloromonas sp.]|nr:hypothetical protein [Dechloromonas sp.]